MDTQLVFLIPLARQSLEGMFPWTIVFGTGKEANMRSPDIQSLETDLQLGGQATQRAKPCQEQ